MQAHRCKRPLPNRPSLPPCAAVIGVSYRAYTRCTAGGGKGSAGSTSGPLLEGAGASDTPRQTLPLYSSRLAPVPE